MDNDPGKPAFDVFISYSHFDRAWADRLRLALEQRGLAVWFDEHNIRPGDLFAKSLEQGLRESRAVALVVSQEALSSAWVEEEYYRALSLVNSSSQLRLIPLLLGQAQLPGFLSSRQWIDFRDETSFEESVNRLYWGCLWNRAAAHNPSTFPPVRNIV